MKYALASTYRKHIKEKVEKIQGIEDALKYIESPSTIRQLEWQIRLLDMGLQALKRELAELEAKGE